MTCFVLPVVLVWVKRLAADNRLSLVNEVQAEIVGKDVMAAL